MVAREPAKADENVANQSPSDSVAGREPVSTDEEWWFYGNSNDKAEVAGTIRQNRTTTLENRWFSLQDYAHRNLFAFDKTTEVIVTQIAAAPLLSSHQSEWDPEGHQPYFDLCLNAYTEVELAPAHASFQLIWTCNCTCNPSPTTMMSFHFTSILVNNIRADTARLYNLFIPLLHNFVCASKTQQMVMQLWHENNREWQISSISRRCSPYLLNKPTLETNQITWSSNKIW